MTTCGIVIPIRAFDAGKSRLAAYLDPADRSRLLAAMAERVVGAAGTTPAVVVSSAPEVVAWAAERGVPVLDDPGTLDGAARAGLAHHRALGATRVAVVHADLPRVESLEPLTRGGDDLAVVVPCHHGDGTPALSIPASVDFEFAYGPGSFERHVAEARRQGLRVVELRDHPGLRRDVDDVEDLLALGDPTP